MSTLPCTPLYAQTGSALLISCIACLQGQNCFKQAVRVAPLPTRPFKPQPLPQEDTVPWEQSDGSLLPEHGTCLPLHSALGCYTRLGVHLDSTHMR